MVSLFINHKSVCLLLTTLVVLQNEDSEYDASARLHVNVIRGLLVSLTFCICFWSRLQLSSSDAYGALALPWFLLLNSTRGWLTDASLLSSFSFVLLRPRHTESNRSSALQTPRRSARKALSSKGNAEGRTWLFSGCQDPICALAKMLARNAAVNPEKELGVFFLCMQGLTIASVSVFYELAQRRDEKVLVSTFVVASCWLSFLLITKAKTTKPFHGYALACIFIFEMYLSNGILRALLSQIRGDRERVATLTIFNLTRLAALWFAGCSISLALFSNRRVQRKEKILSQRKMFHAIAVVMFGVPMHNWRDDYGQILIPVAFATCLVLFCVVENLRVNFLLSNNLTRMMCAWEKERRRGKNVVVLSHSSLLLGIAVPLWLHNERDSSIASLAGLISIGIGDTSACAIGRKFGRVRINKTSTKTFEGFLAFFLTTFSAALLLDPNGVEYGKIAIACAAGALTESTLDSTLDNLVIPLVFLAFVS
jgi:dolichol kinase